ncbi:hypothetical protein CCHR01_02551 [Colletotrichum chrysophilum]|uniref:Uncharacterized protein n=1 Tax=Colletotrichum chrysophilum TaxID=1836956 RepID=A0AAD9AUL8_9PEZI|nr:hypothetical protein CCHR01_02551 [Colletotrichum chrysophilum]
MARELVFRNFNQIAPLTQFPWFKAVHAYISLDPEGLFHIDSSWKYQYYGQTSLTPFFVIILTTKGSPWRTEGKQSIRNRRFSSAVRFWATAVSLAGIDLLKYGRTEKKIYQERGVVFNQRCCLIHHEKGLYTRLSIIGITYGHRPEDWRVWWTWEYEDFAGEFWQLIEEPPISVPGSWVEDIGNFRDVEQSRLYSWQAEETLPLIWSEYRKIRPPI